MSNCGRARRAPYPLELRGVEAFGRDTFVKLPRGAFAGGGSPARRTAGRLLRAEHGDDVAGRFTALEQLWLHDDVMRAVALSPRLGGLAASLLGEPAVRHLPRQRAFEGARLRAHAVAPRRRALPARHVSGRHGVDPGFGDPGVMGPLSFARGAEVRELVADLGSTRSERRTTRPWHVSRERWRWRRRALRRRRGVLPLGAVLPHGRAEPHDAAAPGARHHLLRRRRPRDRVADLGQRPWREFLPGVEPGGLAGSRSSTRSSASASPARTLHRARRPYRPARRGGRPGSALPVPWGTPSSCCRSPTPPRAPERALALLATVAVEGRGERTVPPDLEAPGHPPDRVTHPPVVELQVDRRPEPPAGQAGHPGLDVVDHGTTALGLTGGARKRTRPGRRRWRPGVGGGSGRPVDRRHAPAIPPAGAGPPRRPDGATRRPAARASPIARWPRETVPSSPTHHAADRAWSAVRPRAASPSSPRTCQGTAVAAPGHPRSAHRAAEVQKAQSPS